MRLLKDSEGDGLVLWHSVNYRKREYRDRGLVNRGFWLHVPRLTLTCRLLGHRPVIDGTQGFGDNPGYRWACCDRCGLRPEPQGSLDPAYWNIGDAVPAPMPGSKNLPLLAGVYSSPGSDWNRLDRGIIGGQLVIGRNSSCGFSLKVGSAGSEHTLAAHVGIPFLGALYLHTENFGTWLQRRLVPEGYESRVIEVSAFAGRLGWKIWKPRDSSYSRNSSWRNGSIRIDPRDIFLGEKRYAYKDAATTPAKATLTIPGDAESYEVTMRLELQIYGRKKGRKKFSWIVKCDSEKEIPDGENSWKGGLMGWSVGVSGNPGMWAFDAAEASIAKILKMREDNRRTEGC